jgi:hypothetical protein
MSSKIAIKVSDRIIETLCLSTNPGLQRAFETRSACSLVVRTGERRVHGMELQLILRA